MITISHSRENLRSIFAKPIPPPLIMKPISDHIQVDEEIATLDDGQTLKSLLRKRSGRGKSMSDIMEESNPYATISSTALIRSNTLGRAHSATCNSDIRFHSLCIIPFFEISRIIRSNKMEEGYQNFREIAPDFYNWEAMEERLGDQFLKGIQLDWTDMFDSHPNLIYNFLNSFAEVCQDLSCLNTIARPFWEVIPGYFLYMQLFLSVFQNYVVRRSSQFIIRRNGEDDNIPNAKATECMYVMKLL